MDEVTDPFEGTSYRRLALLGAGGMAQVYVVEHCNLRRRFVAKVLNASLADDVESMERLLFEGRAMGSLQHENLVTVSDCDFLDDGRPFLVMELLEGVTLRDEIARLKALPLHTSLAIARDVLAALDAAHRRGLVHRDIKPENIFLQRTAGGRRVVKVLDWGLAKLLDLGGERGLQGPKIRTRDGITLGTPEYMAPEQALGSVVDGRADIYSVGVVLYEMLTGAGPFAGFADPLRARAERAVPPPSSRSNAANVPKDVDRLVLCAMADHPENRFQSAAEFMHAIDRLLASPGRARLDLRAFGLAALGAGCLTYFLLSRFYEG